jgi:hypothetical protein
LPMIPGERRDRSGRGRSPSGPSARAELTTSPRTGRLGDPTPPVRPRVQDRPRVRALPRVGRMFQMRTFET